MNGIAIHYHFNASLILKRRKGWMKFKFPLAVKWILCSVVSQNINHNKELVKITIFRKYNCALKIPRVTTSMTNLSSSFFSENKIYNGFNK